jgi:hypothetical protein
MTSNQQTVTAKFIQDIVSAPLRPFLAQGA